MSKGRLGEEYRRKVESLKKSAAQNLGLSAAEIEQVFESCEKIIQIRKKRLKSVDPTALQKLSKYLLWLAKYALLLITCALIIYVILNVHQPTSSIVLRNVQGLIYPGLKVWRFLSVPFVKLFPSLTNLYDESCLLENPFFFVSDMECWPCENVHSVMDLSGFTNHSLYQSGVPYIVKTKQSEVTISTLKELYENNTNVLDKEDYLIRSNNKHFNHIQDILSYDPDNPEFSNLHISWRINRMAPARVIRSIFPRPYIVSEWSGQSIERYVMISGPTAPPYPFPNTDCSYVFVVQGSGERIVILKPSRECSGHCRAVSVLLKPSYVLWYNWWYWRPYSIPVENSTESSVSYMSSYC